MVNCIIKAPRVKCFYLTAQGYEAYCRILQRDGLEPLEKPETVYDPPKALRLSRINEATLFFALSACRAFDTAREIKQAMEQNAVRSTDNLRYSRFAGRFPTPDMTYIVYHFGGGNLRLNPNGERNAEVTLSAYPKPTRKMILTDHEGAITDILAYSLWVHRKSSAALQHMQLNYHITSMDDPILLPISRQTQPFARALDMPRWTEKLAALNAQVHNQDSRAISLLDGGWGILLEYSDALADSQSVLYFVIWDFQEPIVQELKRQGLLCCRLQITVYSSATLDNCHDRVDKHSRDMIYCCHSNADHMCH